MRQVLAVVVMVVAGCGKSSDTPPVPVVCTGDVTITTGAEMDSFVGRGCTSVTGHLSITGTSLTSVNLPKLKAADSLEISGNAALANLNLGALTTVPNGQRRCAYHGIPCSDGMAVYNNSSLVTLSLPALTTVESLEVSYNASLVTFSLPALASVGTLRIGGNAGLVSFSLPVLATVSDGDLSVSGNAALTRINLPALTTVTSTGLNGGTLRVELNGLLTSINMPALTAVYALGVWNNTVLTSINLPVLRTVGVGLSVFGNTSYPQCAAVAILAHLIDFTGTWSIQGNDTTATCPP